MTTPMGPWRPYPHNATSTATGNLYVCQGVESSQLGNQRDLLLWLPPDYPNTERRYPVLYMHDGQNLFDQATSFAGEWGIDESMERLAREGIEAIIVGIPSVDGQPFGARQEEYSPFVGEGNRGGKGDAYLAFLTDVVKAQIDARFRTLSGPEHTGIAGSSLGGYISLYGLYARPEVFGFAAAFSPYLWFSEEIFRFIESMPSRSCRAYLDVGNKETGAQEPDARYAASVSQMAALLARKGADLKLTLDDGGLHNEAAWGRRFPEAIRWLLAATTP